MGVVPKVMARIELQMLNRVITIGSDNMNELDKWTSELLDIIDSFGGTNPFPRFVVVSDDKKYYSCTTKIRKERVQEFDQAIKEWLDA